MFRSARFRAELGRRRYRLAFFELFNPEIFAARARTNQGGPWTGICRSITSHLPRLENSALRVDSAECARRRTRTRPRDRRNPTPRLSRYRAASHGRKPLAAVGHRTE